MDRVYVNERGENADEAIDAVYLELFEKWPGIDPADVTAFTHLIDPYIQTLTGGLDISFACALNDADTAVIWASIIGDIAITADNDGLIRPTLTERDRSRARLFARIGSNGDWAFGVSAHHVVLLAGLLVLRNVAESVLNQSADATAH
jgi:hypothetical protein